MRRRALLGALGAGIAGGAGCLSAPGPDGLLGVPASETPWGEDWRTESVDRVVVDSGRAERTGIDASETTLTLPTATATFSLVNRTGDPLQVNPHGWALWRRESDGWRGIYPDGYLQPLTALRPGESISWALRIDNRGTGQGDVEIDTEGDLPTFAGIDPGRYAVSNEVRFSDQPVLVVSVFDIVGE
ncbi:hypothetical protein [Halolamina salifodinae]|uniref:Uncharacterized protein n=1 Tax=Halolamina salifodinae TaxID=1202767 RepID=A0A8T4GRS2_9EURY|nr:hypothetical protein [Halolamina salifodinae]MBP1985727.1 hypothetical protein [Halolamina salifodinae]